jgi:hypothetical protein
MKLTSKIAATFAVLALASTAHAAGINGGISFNGDYTPQTLLGVNVTDLNLAQQIAFGGTAVNSFGGTSGSFTLIPANTAVTMFTPLKFSPVTVLPITPLWTVTDGTDTFTFTMSSFSAGPVVVDGGVQSVKLSGSGMLSYTGPASLTPTMGAWVGTFTNGSSTFSWASSSAANVPDGGATLALLGISFLGLGGVSRLVRRK